MISIIACISRNRAIGYQNQLLYHIKSDMARFKKLTMGHTIIMGRKTFESLPHGALPHRHNVVVSQSQKEILGCQVVGDLEEAIKTIQANTHPADEVFIIGGESIYRQALPYASHLYLTIVEDEAEQADAFFPEIDLQEWRVTEKEIRNENGLAFSFLTYQGF